MPDTSFPGPEDRDRMARRHGELDRICVSLDTLVRVDEVDVHVVADACYGLAQFLRARGSLGTDRLSAWLRSGERQPQPSMAAPAGPASAQPVLEPVQPALDLSSVPAKPAPPAQTAPGGPPCEEQLLQQQEPTRRLALAKDGLAFLDKVNYYLNLAAARKDNPAAVADAIGSVDCLPVPHAAIAAADLVAGQTTWDQAYATFTDLKVLGIIDGQDEAGILFAMGDRPGTVRIVPGDERDPIDDEGAHVLPPEATPPPEGSVL